MRTTRLVIAAALALLPLSTRAEEPQPLEIRSVLVNVLDKADVPARETGVLATLDVREGDVVHAGQVLGHLDDTVAKLDRGRVNAELELARTRATNDVRVRFAQKAEAVTQAELKRAQESVEKFSKAVSQTEMDRLRLTTEKATLEIEQAQRDCQEAELEMQVKQQEARLADEMVDRHTIVAPISGVVVQVSKGPGEWIKPGETVLRIVRIDRLRAEGFADAKQFHRQLAGAPVTLTVEQTGAAPETYSGKLVFISPEVNRFNEQVRVWAEIENPELTLRPGLTATLSVSTTHPNRSAPPAK